MKSSSANELYRTGAAKRITQRTLVMVENRLQRLMVEARGGRESALPAVRLALWVAAFGLLAGMALTVVITGALRSPLPVIALLVMTALIQPQPRCSSGVWPRFNGAGKPFREFLTN